MAEKKKEIFNNSVTKDGAVVFRFHFDGSGSLAL